MIRILGPIYANDGFADRPKVPRGFYHLMVEVFGETKKSVRYAILARILCHLTPQLK